MSQTPEVWAHGSQSVVQLRIEGWLSELVGSEKCVERAEFFPVLSGRDAPKGGRRPKGLLDLLFCASFEGRIGVSSYTG